MSFEGTSFWKPDTYIINRGSFYEMAYKYPKSRVQVGSGFE